MEEIETLYDREFQARREDPLKVAPPGGETTLQVQERVLAAIQSVVQVHPGETVAIFSHGFAIAVIRAYFSNHPPVRIRELVPHNGEIITIDLPDGLSPAKS
jgi:broad specificity phosphatase PhoE